jgi:hypothetical protein
MKLGWRVRRQQWGWRGQGETPKITSGKEAKTSRGGAGWSGKMIQEFI